MEENTIVVNSGKNPEPNNIHKCIYLCLAILYSSTDMLTIFWIISPLLLICSFNQNKATVLKLLKL